MKNFKDVFNKKPNSIIENVYYYDSDEDGDKFSNDDALWWLDKGFKYLWDKSFNHTDKLFNSFHKEILETYNKNPLPFMEIACGPGMGLTPLILANNPNIPVLITDACSLVIRSWNEFIKTNLSNYNIDLASFSITNMPLKSNSINYVTSFLGISSTRAGEVGKITAIKEVYRVLKKGGYFITIEHNWTDLNKIQKVFDLWGKPIWDDFLESFNKTWVERFTECGFEVCYEKVFNRFFNRNDNDLGEQAYIHGIKIGVKNTLFILKKQ